jgi:hypothetical protein
MILKGGKLQGPLSAVRKTAISDRIPKPTISKPTISKPTITKPKPTTGWNGAAGGGPAGRGLGRSPILKKYSTSL